MTDVSTTPATTPAFPAVVHTYTDALRLLRDQGPTSLSRVAELTGRVRSNLRRDKPRLIEAGVLLCDDDNSELLTVTDTGLQWVAGQDVAEGRAPAIDRPADGDRRWPHQIGDILFLNHAQILPDPAQVRADWDSEEAVADLDALRQDILENGLLLNLVVRGPIDRAEAESDRDSLPAQAASDRVASDSSLYVLVAGERRWRAIGAAINEDDWPRDRLIPCRLHQADDLGYRLAALAENLQRRNLNPLEKARAFDGLAEAYLAAGLEDDKINRQIADRVGVTIEHIQQHRAFLKLDEADQLRLTLPKDDPRRLTVRDARAKLARKTEKDTAWSPLQLPADDQLTLAELTHAVRAFGAYLGRQIPVASGARTDAAALRLAEVNLIALSDTPHSWGEDAGHYRAALYGWGTQDACRNAWPALLGDDDPDVRNHALASMQRERARVPEPGHLYVTPWLNPPFALTPEGQAVLDSVAAQEQARQAADRQRREEREARTGRLALTRVHADALLARAATAPAAPLIEDIDQIARQIEHPLPWTATAEGEVIDSAGEEVTDLRQFGFGFDDGTISLAMLIAVAVNTAAGLATPPLRIQTDQDDDDGQTARAEEINEWDVALGITDADDDADDAEAA